MQHSAEMLRCLAELDVDGARRLWRHVSPGLPVLDDKQALVVVHMARTQAAGLPLRPRAYSHRWLLDAGLPSQLPDELRPRAERLYPRVVEAVGISVNATSPILKPATKIIERAMSDAVAAAFADGITAPEFLRARMAEARGRELVKLFGRGRVLP